MRKEISQMDILFFDLNLIMITKKISRMNWNNSKIKNRLIAYIIKSESV